MKVKICGLTNKEDAIWAINYGADYVGLNFFKESPRHISIATASKWVAELPPFASTVGIFVNAETEEIVKTLSKIPLKGVQFHGDETPEYLSSLKEKIKGSGRTPFFIKAFRMADESSLTALDAYLDVVDYFLLDSCVQDQVGGTGVRFNWDLAIKAKDLGKPIILAGGLTPDNVKEAIKKVAPFAVDVASGVEKSPKRKDLEKLKNFITIAKK